MRMSARLNLELGSFRRSHLVLTILIKLFMAVRRVTIWALPVHESVTVITGQENPRNSSKDSKKWPHDLSYLVNGCQSQPEYSPFIWAHHGMLYTWK
jgi:hypothetical protein